MAEAVGILLIALLVCFLLLRIRLFKRTTLCEYEKGLCYKRGKFLKMLEPGVYWHWGWITRIQKSHLQNPPKRGRTVLALTFRKASLFMP